MREIEFKAYWADTKEEVIDFCAEYLIEDCNSDNFIVCQYTGLKDRNGTKIFEGDGFKIGIEIGYVTFNDGCFFLDGMPLAVSANHREIIGNINEQNN